MASFGYTVNSSATTWSTTNSSDSLSFSADGKLIAYADQGKNRVWIISADSGVDVGQVADRAAVLFSPSDSDKIVVQAIGVVQVFKRDSPTGSTWSKVGEDGYSSIRSIAFNSTGTTFFLIEHGNLVQYNDTLTRTNAQAVEGKTSALDCSPDGTTIIRGCTDGAVYCGTWTSPTADVSFNRLNGNGDSQVTVCAWSDDAQWVATGDTKGDVRLWDASRKDSISLSLLLRPNSSADRINKLIFVPDSTGLIILSGSSVFVWDIGQQTYLSDIGLPSTATNIALDDENVRIALSTDTGISIYDLKKTTSTDNSNTNTGNNTGDNTSTNTSTNTDSNNLPGGRRKGRGKGKATNVVPDELKEMDITAQVFQTESFRYEGLFFNIYKGSMRVQANTTFQHSVAIKALRVGIDPRTTAEKRQEFESALYEELKKWYQLTQNNSAETSKIIVPLLGVTCAPEFGGKPAIVTSWMEKGLLNEYVEKNKANIDEIELMQNLADAVTYLHERDIIHGDIRASSVLVDAFGNPRLSDLGLLKVLEKGPLGKGTTEGIKWKAPELLTSSPSPISKATDVFAFTMTCWEIYSGKTPFEDVAEYLVGNKITGGERPERPEQVQDEVWDLWQEGWNADASKRPTIADYVKRLDAID